MTVSSAANAVLAKARAMYGKRLTAQNYTDLLACRSVNEAAAYLKAHTAYADAFEGVTMGSLRRWQIEILLREHLSNNFASLCRYEKSIGDGFYKYFVTLSDVDMLLHSVRYLKRLTNMPQSVLTTMLMPGGTLDEKALTGFMKAPDAEKALQTLKGTAYAAFAERGDRSVEQVSAKLRYDRAKGLVRFSTFPSVVMMSYVALAENEAENLTHIIEGIRYNIPPEEISRLLIGVGD